VRRFIEVATLAVAATLEVCGDAVIRTGLRTRGIALVITGFAALGSYGVLVNLLPIDFSKLIGTYVAFFAMASLAIGRLLFGDVLPWSTWLGAAFIVLGSSIIQWGAPVSPR
jgi:small multidrug resistance family-3 protein